jgi:hypothetical protein
VDLQWLVPLGTFLGIVGGGVGWLISRADKRRENREAMVIATLKERIDELKVLVRRLERKVSALRATAGKWREQLIANDIKPDPPEWPKDEDE